MIWANEERSLFDSHRYISELNTKECAKFQVLKSQTFVGIHKMLCPQKSIQQHRMRSVVMIGRRFPVFCEKFVDF